MTFILKKNKTMTQTQEDKELLLRDLCARLPYGVMLKHISTEKPFNLFSIKRDKYASYKKDGVELAMGGIYYDWVVNNIYHDIELYVRPYLRPLSSMTKGERKELLKISNNNFYAFSNYISNSNSSIDGEWHSSYNNFVTNDVCNKLISWLDKNHFDHRTDDEGETLIEKGLAIAVTEENNPYKD